MARSTQPPKRFSMAYENGTATCFVYTSVVLGLLRFSRLSVSCAVYTQDGELSERFLQVLLTWSYKANKRREVTALDRHHTYKRGHNDRDLTLFQRNLNRSQFFHLACEYIQGP